MGRQIAIYGLLLAAGTLVLQWLDYRRLGGADSAGGLALVALGFLGLGIWFGWRVLAARVERPAGNPAALVALGITPRERAVLDLLAAGRSTREIADALHVSPNTVKTHVARLFEKLGARRRTEAISRARDLGIMA
jgi:DNA-binding CsgD family transcriptional regulator